METIEKIINDAVSYITVTAIAAVTWLVRRVFTNQKQLEMLKAEMAKQHETAVAVRAAREAADATRHEAAQRKLDDLKDDVQAIRQRVDTLFQRHE